MEKREDYTAVVATLETRFGSHHLQQDMNQLKTRIQPQSESVQEYGADIESLVRLDYPDADLFPSLISHCV